MAYVETGERIRNFRKNRGLSQDELAELASLNRVTVAKYESGKVEPGAQSLGRIADALDVSVDKLLGRSEPELPNLVGEAAEFHEWLRRDPNARTLFDVARKSTPEHIRAATAVLMALKPKGDAQD